MQQVTSKDVLANEKPDKSLKLSFGKSLFAFIFVGPIWLAFLQVSLTEILNNQIVLMQVVLMIVSSLMFTLEFRKPKPSPLVLVIWVFNCGVVGVPGLSQILADAFPWPLIVESGNLLLAQVCTLIASVFLILVLEAPHKQKPQNSISRNLDRIRVRNLTLLMVPTLLYAIRSGGGIKSFFSSRGAISAAKSAAGLTKAQSGLFVTGTQALVLLVCVSAILLRKKNPKDPIANVALALSSVGLLILANPLSASRFWFFTVLTTVSIATLTLTPGRIRTGAMTLFFGSMFVFPLADYFRRSDRTFGSVGTSAWLTGDFDALQITGAGIQWFQENGAVWGHQLLGAMFPVIPRSIWTGKPIDTGIMIAQFNGMKFDNISGPWVSEGIINFGFLGVLIFPFMIGYLFRIVKFRSELFPDDFGTILNAFLVGYLPILMRGSLIQASGAAGIFTIYVWYATPKVREKSNQPPISPGNTQALQLKKVA